VDAGEVQHLVTYDRIGLGYRGSCELVVAHKGEAVGDYVWFLDDDDVLFEKNLSDIVRKIKIFDAPDIIIARVGLRDKLIPVDALWYKRDFRILKICNVGLPNFIMKNAIFKEYIHNIALRNEYTHDYDIMKAWQRDDPERHFKVYYLDTVILKQREGEGRIEKDRHQKERLMIKLRTDRLLEHSG
jgi:glycosyltransferase involved in cell wall biosynthesis